MSYYLELLEKQSIKVSRDIISLHIAHDARSTRRKSAFSDDGRRICSSCFVPKDQDQFTTKRSSVDGKDPRCKQCKSKLQIERARGKR